VTATAVGGSGPSLIPTTTELEVSNTVPAIGEAVTYTATVTPETLEGSAPSGSVEFFDGGNPIGPCTAQPLTQFAFSSTAGCTINYSAAGSHTITASCGGDSTYDGSSSAGHTVTVQESSEGGGGGEGGGSGGGGGGTTTTPAQPAPLPSCCSAPPSGSVGLLQAVIAAKPNGRAAPMLDCMGTGTCSGKLTLAVGSGAKGKKRKRKRGKTKVIGRASFSIPAGKSVVVGIKGGSPLVAVLLRLAQAAWTPGCRGHRQRCLVIPCRDFPPNGKRGNAAWPEPPKSCAGSSSGLGRCMVAAPRPSSTGPGEPGRPFTARAYPQGASADVRLSVSNCRLRQSSNRPRSEQQLVDGERFRRNIRPPESGSRADAGCYGSCWIGSLPERHLAQPSDGQL
jgi:hypothetical protein